MALEWVDDYFRDVDLVQADKLAAWFADDINLRFGNQPAISDKKTALHALGAFFDSIAGMRRWSEATVGTTSEAARQAIVTYTRRDGREVPLPVSSYLHRDAGGKIDKLWIYIDINPLYADVAAK